MPNVKSKHHGNPKRFDVEGPVQVQAPSKPVNIAPVPKVVKKPNAADNIYEANIHERSSLKLYLDELVSVRGLDARGRQPEWLVFHYPANVQRVWPLHKILEEDYKVIVSVYTKMDSYGRSFSGIARTILCNKISEIRRSWATTDGPPRKYTIPYTGKNVHLQPD